MATSRTERHVAPGAIAVLESEISEGVDRRGDRLGPTSADRLK